MNWKHDRESTEWRCVHPTGDYLIDRIVVGDCRAFLLVIGNITAGPFDTLAEAQAEAAKRAGETP